MNDRDIRRKSAQDKIKELAKEAGTTKENLLEAMFLYYRTGKIDTVLQKHNFKRIDIEDNNDDYSGHYYGIFEIDGKFYKTYYRYQSHWGSDFDNSYNEIIEVSPTTKSVVSYD